jgi:hypothetical protein
MESLLMWLQAIIDEQGHHAKYQSEELSTQ